jgi:hypothetical protein
VELIEEIQGLEYAIVLGFMEKTNAALKYHLFVTN